MNNLRLLPTIAIILIIFVQACKKKEEEAPLSPVKQLNNVEMLTGTLIDLAEGKSYQVAEAVENASNIDITYAKKLNVSDGTNTETIYKVLITSNVLTVSGGQQPFTNETLFAPISTTTDLSTITDPDQLRIMYDQAAKDTEGSPSSAVVNLAARQTVMFKIRSKSSAPKYGGIYVNAVSPDSLSTNVSVTVQR